MACENSKRMAQCSHYMLIDLHQELVKISALQPDQYNSIAEGEKQRLAHPLLQTCSWY